MPLHVKSVELIRAKNGHCTFFISVIFCSCTTTLKCAVTTTHCSKLTLIHFAHDKKDVAALLRSGIYNVISAVWCNPQLSEPRWLWRTLTAVVEMSGLRFCLFFWRSRNVKTQITTRLKFPPHLSHTWFSKSALNWRLHVYITLQLFFLILFSCVSCLQQTLRFVPAVFCFWCCCSCTSFRFLILFCTALRPHEKIKRGREAWNVCTDCVVAFQRKEISSSRDCSQIKQIWICHAHIGLMN